MAVYRFQLTKQVVEGEFRELLEVALPQRVSVVAVLDGECVVVIEPDRDGDAEIVATCYDMYDPERLKYANLAQTILSDAFRAVRAAQFWEMARSGRIGYEV